MSSIHEPAEREDIVKVVFSAEGYYVDEGRITSSRGGRFRYPCLRRAKLWRAVAYILGFRHLAEARLRLTPRCVAGVRP